MTPDPVNTKTSDNIDAIKSDGTVVSAVRSGTSKGCTLAVATYYFPLGSSEAPLSAGTSLVHAHLKWAAAVAATITVETCSFTRFEGGFGGANDDVTDYSTTAGDWIQENPSTAIVAVSGASNTSTAATVTAGGAAAGGCSFHLGNLGSRRARVKVVATVGGLVRCAANGKAG